MPTVTVTFSSTPKWFEPDAKCAFKHTRFGVVVSIIVKREKIGPGFNYLSPYVFKQLLHQCQGTQTKPLINVLLEHRLLMRYKWYRNFQTSNRNEMDRSGTAYDTQYTEITGGQESYMSEIHPPVSAFKANERHFAAYKTFFIFEWPVPLY